nr:putative ribonuclease H-like domain-containing protein [Tanacetum cinerariifolium]
MALAEAVNTACYIQNRVLVTKPHNKTLYELLHGRTPSIGFMRHFGCPVTILNTLDSLGKFKGKVDEGFLVGYSVNSKAFRVFNSRTRIVQETLHVNFLENKPNVAGSGPTWLFDIDSLTRTINYQPVTAGNQTNPNAGFQDKFDVEKAKEEIDQQYVLFPVWSSGSINPQNYDGDAAFDGKEHDFDAKKHESEVILSPSSSAQSRKQDDKTKKEAKGKSHVESFTGYRDLSTEFEDCSDNSSNKVNAAGTIVPTVGQTSLNSTNTFSAAGHSNAVASPTYGKSSFIDASQLFDDPDMPELEDIIYSDDDNYVGAEADFNNLETSITVSPIPTTRVHKDHPVSQIIGDLSSTTQTRSMTRVVKDQGGLSQMFNDDFHTCMFVCFLSQEDSKRVFRNKKDERGIVVRNKARLVAQGHTHKERIDYEEVFAPVARIEAIRLFLAYASFMGFMVYQMDVKSAFPYGTIEEEVYVSEGKSASTPIDSEKTLLNDPDGEDVDVHTYRSMIGSLMYLTSSRPDIMFAAEYVAAASYCAQVLWIQNQLLDYSDSPLLGVNTPRNDEDRLELMELMVFLLPTVEKVGTGVNAVDLQVSAVRHMLLLEGFNQIIDFLNGSYIKYALTVNLNIYVSCIKQFWNTVAIKQVNDITRLQALVDKKRVVVTEASIRECMSAKRTSWNEFSSSTASAVICLSTGDLSTHTTKYASPTLTQKVFANIRRVGKGFSRVDTPLFEGMPVAQEIEEEGDADEHVEYVTSGDDAHGDDTAAHGEVPTVQQTLPQSPQVQPPPQPQPQPQQAADFPMSLLQETLDACVALTRRVEHLEYDKVAQALEITKLKRRRVDTSDDTVMDDESNQGRMIAEMDKDDVVVLMDDKEDDKKVEEAKVVESAQEDETEPAEVQEVVDVVTTAKDPEEESTTSTIIPETKSKDKGKWILVEEPKPLKKKQQIEMDKEYARKLHAKLNKDIDWDVAIDHVKLKAKEDPTVKRYQAMKRKPQTEAQARKNMMMYLKNVAGFKLDYFKGMSYDGIRLIFEAKFNSNVDFLLKTKEQIEEEENRALQTINETLAEKAAKRRKLNEEVEDLKRHLEIVPDKDDDVYTKATPLARKVPVMDYEIIELNNKPYYKIIRVDRTHQLYISFLTLLKNFDRENLEAL